MSFIGRGRSGQETTQANAGLLSERATGWEVGGNYASGGGRFQRVGDLLLDRDQSSGIGCADLADGHSRFWISGKTWGSCGARGVELRGRGPDRAWCCRDGWVSICKCCCDEVLRPASSW